MENKITPKFLLKVGGRLFLIAAVVAVLLAFVSEMTKDKIAENKAAVMNERITQIFGDGIESEEVEADADETVTAVYRITNEDSSLAGYAVYVVPMGFKGDVEMMVGVNTDGTCRGVRIISQSETPGLGAKVAEDVFLSQYNSQNGGLEVKKNIDAVAGATISSKAVTGGVNSALAIDFSQIGGGN